jgi:adenylate cyclase
MKILVEIRKIRFHIVTIFSSLIIFFSLVMIFLMHWLNYRGLTQLSMLMIEQVADGVAGTMAGFTTQKAQFVKAVRGMIVSPNQVNPNNQPLITLLFDALKYNPTLSNVSAGTTTGDFLIAYDLHLSQLSNYHFSPERLLPFEAKYALRIVENSQIERWEYKDSDLVTIATESSTIISEDLRLAPWFQKVAIWPHFSWITDDTGFDVSAPIWDAEQNFIGVFSTRIQYEQLYNLITHQKVGTTGQIYLLNEDGTALIPSKIPALATNAFDLYGKEKKSSFTFDQNNKTYVCHFAPFPLDIKNKWLLSIIVPFDDFFSSFEKVERKTVSFSIIILFFCGFLIILASKILSRPLVHLTEHVNLIRKFDFRDPVPPIKAWIWEISILNNSIGLMRAALRSFERYVPKQIIQSLLEQGKEIAIGGERRELTILFSDIENFTSKTESFGIDQLVPALTEYFNVLSKIITDTGGTIDKYIGDSVMAFWNAPKILHDHSIYACTAALRFTKRAKKSDNVFLKETTRFGIHAGEVIVGNFGSTERLNYTALGDTVNVCSRLQSLNKEYHTSILISESVQEGLGLRFLTRPLDFVSVRGRQKRITIFELIALLEGDPDLIATPEEIELCQSFTKAYETFHAGKIEEAKVLFSKILEKFPSDGPTKNYLSRIS